MDSNNRSLIFLMVGVALFVCICVAALIFAAVSFLRPVTVQTSPATPPIAVTVGIEPVITPPGATPTPEDASPPSNPSATPTPSTPTAAENGISADVLAQMLEIEKQVIALRGLQPNGEFSRALFSPEQLRERVINDFFQDYTPEEAREDALVLAAFGLVDPDFDFHTFYVDLLSEQVAGFYDNETKEMVVVQTDAFRGPERLTYAHEYTHALQDQNYDFENGLQYNDETCEEDSERCAAIQALIEGDASLTEFHWFFEHSTTKDQREIQEFYSNYESPIFDAAPPFLQDDFIFPYDQGFEFVSYLFEEGGFPAVDAAYQTLPLSTEQILHPDRYPNDLPIPVTLPDLLPALGQGWTLLDEDVMGEWYTYLILARGIDPAFQLDDQTAAEAAAGWGGDAYAVYLAPSGDATALVLLTVWDTPADAEEFAEAFAEYATARFDESTGDGVWQGAEGAAWLTQTGDQTIWVLAPDLPTAQALLAILQP